MPFDMSNWRWMCRADFMFFMHDKYKATTESAEAHWQDLCEDPKAIRMFDEERGVLVFVQIKKNEKD